MFRCILSLTVFSVAACLHAKPPEFGAIFPGGGQRGSTFEITTTITNKPVSQWWTSAPGVTFTATDKPGKWKVTIPADTPLGLYPIVRHNENGVSSTRWFSVGRLPEIEEKEPNNGFSNRQKIDSLPVCVNAKLGEANDVDHFQISLRKGQTLVAMVEAYSIGSPVDVMAHVLSPEGERLLTASDHRNLDPFFSFTAPVDGNYTLQIAGFAHPPQANVNYTGSAAVVYRLHLTTGPVVTHFHPLAVSDSQPTAVSLQGYNLDPAKREATIDARMLRHDGGKLLVDLPDALMPLQALAIPATASVEQEPNDTREEATKIQQGYVGGSLTGPGDEDRFAIEMKKGAKLQAAVYSAALGIPLDASLRVEAPDGKLVLENDDHDGKPDPRVIWTAAADGIYQIVIADTLQKGRSACHYVLGVTVPKPSVSMILATPQRLSVKQGESQSVKFAIKRMDGWKKPLLARVGGLPEGVSAPDVTIDAKDTEVEIKITAAENVAVGNHLLTFRAVSPSSVVEGSTEAISSDEEVFPAAISLRGDTARGTSLLDVTDSLWLSVLPQSVPEVKK